MTEPYLTLKDMTGGGGCTPRTVRYYERQGLLQADRSAGGHRLFAASQLERLHFIVALREAGWALDDIIALLGARHRSGNDHEAAGHLHEMLHAQIERLEKKLTLLTTLREDLRKTHTALQICQECTQEQGSMECGTCERLPELDELPRGFRLTWRARDLGGAPFDDGDVDSALASP